MNTEEKFVFDWQYRRLGGFKTALINAIKLADKSNREKLRLGFPDEVGGYESFSTVPGWWDEVEAKATLVIAFAEDISEKDGSRT